jgi:hypothetical protein
MASTALIWTSRTAPLHRSDGDDSPLTAAAQFGDIDRDSSTRREGPIEPTQVRAVLGGRGLGGKIQRLALTVPANVPGGGLCR